MVDVNMVGFIVGLICYLIVTFMLGRWLHSKIHIFGVSKRDKRREAIRAAALAAVPSRKY